MEEFGSQGFKPTHPKLLDWLAVEFMTTHQWRIKSLIKQVVMSASYRQSSDVDEQKLELDPLNQYLSRGPRIRLSGEQIRDAVLQVSGLLDKSMGGPSVVIPELNIPAHAIPSWALYTEEDTDDTPIYRRSIYTFWRRTDPFPSMMTFDSPDRTLCSSRRIRTNTPLQALNLLNNKTYFEAAKTLAIGCFDSRLTPEENLSKVYRRVLLKSSTKEQLDPLKKVYKDALDHFTENRAELDKIFPRQQIRDKNKKQIAALGIVVNVLLNLDEFVVKK